MLSLVLYLSGYALISYEDLRIRKFSALYLGLILVGSVVKWDESTLTSAVVNSTLLLLIFLLSFIYFKLLRKEIDLKTVVGLGDIFILIVSTPIFLPIIFMSILVISLLSSIIFGLTSVNPEIPFAGIFSLATIAFLITQSIIGFE